MASASFYLALATLFAVLAVSQGHLYVIGARGAHPNDPSYFAANSQAPCGGATAVSTNYLNVTKNAIFPISWTLIVNHNTPPSPTGSVKFGYASGIFNSPTTMTNPIASSAPVSTQPNNEYYVSEVVVPPLSGPGTIQIVYDLMGAPPGNNYYQCIDVWVG